MKTRSTCICMHYSNCDFISSAPPLVIYTPTIYRLSTKCVEIPRAVAITQLNLM